MSLGLTPVRRRFERLFATVSAVAVLMSMMVIFAPAALAHHPEIDAYQTCLDQGLVIHWDAISWKTDGTSGSGHSDIRIEVQVNGTGGWDEVASGAFTDANDYRFSGDFDASPYLGESIAVRARADGPWDNGIGGGETRQTALFDVDLNCTETVSVTANPQACAINQQGVPQGTVSFEIDPASGATVQVYANSNFTGPVGGALGDGVSLPLAPGTYYWQATASEGFEIEGSASGQFTIAPCGSSVTVVADPCVLNDNQAPVGLVEVAISPTSGATVVITGPGGPYNFSGSGGSMELAPGSYSWQATSGAGFTLTGPDSGEFTIEPCTASVVVSAGVCDLIDGPLGPVEVTIDPDDAATVTIYSDAEMTNAVASFEDLGGSTTLSPGTYYWEGVAESGFELEGDTEGTFTIEPCEASAVVVSGGCVIDGGVPVGLIEVTINPDSGATVVVQGPGGPYNFSGSGGSMQLAPGSYSWTANAASGFALTGGSSGEFDVESCDVSVLVASGECEATGGPLGTVTVFIEADSGAMVTVYDSDMNVAADFTGVGGASSLPPGSYTWTATPGDGFEFPADQPTSGEFTIVPCGAAVIVTHGNCVVDTPTAFGSVNVGIAPEAAASVTVFDSSQLEVAVFGDAGGHQSLLAGDYTWSAVAAPGYQLSGPTSGGFEVVACPDEVGGVSILPFTGMDSETLLGVSILLLGMGIYLIHIARRGEEG
jgi:hypothetical protein